MSGKVLVTSRSFGQVSDEPVKILEKNGITIDYKNKSGLMEEEDFLKIIDQYDGIIIGADAFTAKVMAKAAKLKIICKHGVGLDSIDLEAAKNHHIAVTNVPATNSDAVADLTFGLIIDVTRKVSFTATQVKNKHWNKVIGTDVCHKTLGIIGFGAIGQRVAKRAFGFGMKVIVHDSFIKEPPEDFFWVKMVSLDELLCQADIETVHIPLNADTRNLIDDAQLRIMKPGSFIINTARGGIVNEAALYKYLKNGHLGGAGLDVTEQEPPDGNPLLALDNVTLVSHIASYSKEAINKVSIVCAQNIVSMLTGKPVAHRVV
jgi:D-3-phosphoglycerate dehydrogenase